MKNDAPQEDRAAIGARVRLDLDAARRRLAQVSGQEYWRSLEELARGEGFREFLQEEFPGQTVGIFDALGRRRFLQLMGASLALAGLNACTRQPPEEIVPYVRRPEEIVPGEPLFFATALPLGGAASGVLVESHLGRPTKVEGSPEHPSSLGAADVLSQASVLTLYDPDRSQVISYVGEIRPWSALAGALLNAMQGQAEQGGAGLRILTETVTSPTMARQLRDLLAEYPRARWHQYEPVNRDNAHDGARLAFGEAVDTQHRLADADVIVALDADFLSCGPGHLRAVREFSARRRVTGEQKTMNRLYAVESSLSNTGAAADHRLPLRSAEIEDFARALLARVGGSDGTPAGLQAHAKWIEAVAEDLTAHRGSSVVIAGDTQPPVVHALVHALNEALGNVGKTVVYTETVAAEPVNQTESLGALVADMNAGRVQVLLLLGGNPVYTAPADLRFAEALARVPLSVHLSLYHDETSEACHWHVAEAHPLESWGDARAHDGTVSLMQPLIAPLYGGKSAHEILAALLGRSDRSGYDIVRGYWSGQVPAPVFERFWRKAVHDGVMGGTAFAPKQVALKPRWRSPAVEAEPGRDGTDTGLEVVFRADANVFDGRFANNGWLQELARPVTRLTWDNAALFAPATAERLGLSNEDVVVLRLGDLSVRAPVWIVPGHARDSVTVQLGYGRTRAGKIGNGTGFNAYAIRTARSPWFAAGLAVERTGERYALATTQHHHSMEGRAVARSAPLDEYLHHPELFHEMAEEPARDFTLYNPDEFASSGYAWGMTIDLNACVGCNACVAACQAENNIAVVGKDEVARGHEMQWIRVDRYFSGDLDNPETLHQPVPCMQCENAPCEVVCPVGATVHSSEGLNDMVYNRCVGTKYCSNNCPYKVRRFNWFLYSDWNTESLKMQRNPDVTVRSRGVMEKCTYCVQRINAARIDAQKENRSIRDGEIVTACQQTCPAEAIVFGNVNDPKSRVSRLKAEARNYALLGGLNTRPRTTYLARLRNPNPKLT